MKCIFIEDIYSIASSHILIGKIYIWCVEVDLSGPQLNLYGTHYYHFKWGTEISALLTELMHAFNKTPQVFDLS